MLCMQIESDELAVFRFVVVGSTHAFFFTN